MFLLGLFVAALVIVGLFVAVFRWASGDPTIDREAAKKSFQAEQAWRDLRRTGKV